MKQQNVSGVTAAIIIVGALIAFFVVFSQLKPPVDPPVVPLPVTPEMPEASFQDMYRGLSPLGITILLPPLAEDRRRGLRVSGVGLGSPAASAGLQAGDLLTAFDGYAIPGMDPLMMLLRTADPQKTYLMRINRSGKELTLKATGIVPPAPEEQLR